MPVPQAEVIVRAVDVGRDDAHEIVAVLLAVRAALDLQRRQFNRQVQVHRLRGGGGGQLKLKINDVPQNSLPLLSFES